MIMVTENLLAYLQFCSRLWYKGLKETESCLQTDAHARTDGPHQSGFNRRRLL